jgi:hypothetical protein
MSMSNEGSARTTLEARRQQLIREMFRVEQQIVRAERMQVQLEERIRLLEEGQRKAA